jgi:2-succinyl-5-enolpyruvyl-6-hydroxy-3-cyclohexene-1-carboxylate synthase
MSGSAFVEMKKHEDFAEALRLARLEREARKEGEQEARERQQWQERRQANERSMAQVTRNQLSWHELREIEEAKRRDRIERRKQQLISSSTLPMGIAECMEKSKRTVTPSSTRGEGSTTFKAEDPEKVCCSHSLLPVESVCLIN